MAALLPRETAAGRSAEDEAEPEDFLDAPEDLPVVLDPACGTATALLAVADRFGDRVKLAGQEISQDYARTARFNLSGNANGAAYEVYAGDSFLDNQLAPYLGKAAAVVCEPPFDSPQWPETELTTDPRWEFGIPAPRDGELAWVQHCYAHLRPRGVAVVAVSQRTCVQHSGRGHTRSPGPFGSIAGRDRPAAGHDVRTRHGPLPVGPAAALRRAGPRAGADDRPVRPR